MLLARAALARPRGRARAAPRSGPPLVHSPLFSAPADLPSWPAQHRFPMGVFQRIYAHLLQTGTVGATQVVAPPPLPEVRLTDFIATGLI